MSRATIGSWIGPTRTQTGLWVCAELDRGKHPKGRKVTDDEMAQVHRVPDRFHGDGNDTVRPKQLGRLGTAVDHRAQIVSGRAFLVPDRSPPRGRACEKRGPVPCANPSGIGGRPAVDPTRGRECVGCPGGS